VIHLTLFLGFSTSAIHSLQVTCHSSTCNRGGAHFCHKGHDQGRAWTYDSLHTS